MPARRTRQRGEVSCGYMSRPPARSLQAAAADGCMWRNQDPQCWDMGSGGRPLVGLQLEDWMESDPVSSNEVLTGIACLADLELQPPRRGCQGPLRRASSAAQQPVCQPGLSSPRSADEVGSQLRCAGPPLDEARVREYARATGAVRR